MDELLKIIPKPECVVSFEFPEEPDYNFHNNNNNNNNLNNIDPLKNKFVSDDENETLLTQKAISSKQTVFEIQKKFLKKHPYTLFGKMVAAIAENARTRQKELNLKYLSKKGIVLTEKNNFRIKKDFNFFSLILDFMRNNTVSFAAGKSEEFKAELAFFEFDIQKMFEPPFYYTLAGGAIGVLKALVTDDDEELPMSASINDPSFGSPSGLIPQESFNLDFDRISIFTDQILGRGANGNVYSGVMDEQKVAIKPIGHVGENEVTALRNCMGKGIVLIFGVTFGKIVQREGWWIVTELCKSDVSRALTTLNLNLVERLLMARDAAAGLAWLSQRGHVHSDVKPQNLFIAFDETVKVGDFDTSVDMTKEKRLQGFTPAYVAPEILSGGLPSEAADVFSLGRTIFEMIYLRKAWEKNQETKVQKVLDFTDFVPWSLEATSKENPYKAKGKLNFWVKMEKDHPLKVLIEKCTAQNPLHRPTFRQILSQLNSIISMVGIRDTTGRDFWNEINPQQKLMPRDAVITDLLKIFPPAETDLVTFIDAESDEKQIPEKAYELGMSLLASVIKGFRGRSERTQTMHAADFGHFLDWFAPFDKNIYLRIKHAVEVEAFWGEIPREKADKLLQKRYTEIGDCHLVRLSNSGIIAHFTVDYTMEKAISHRRLHYAAEVQKDGPLKKFSHSAQPMTLREILVVTDSETPIGSPVPDSPYYASSHQAAYMSHYFDHMGSSYLYQDTNC